MHSETEGGARNTGFASSIIVVPFLYALVYVVLGDDRAAAPGWASTWIVVVPVIVDAAIEWQRSFTARHARRVTVAAANALLLFAALATVYALIHAFVRPLEALGSPTVPGCALLAPVLAALGLPTVAAGAELHVTGEAGLVTFRLGSDKLVPGPLLFAGAALALVATRARRAVRYPHLVLAFAGAVALRLLVSIVWLAQTPELFTPRGSSRLADVFGARWLDGAAVLAFLLASRRAILAARPPAPLIERSRTYSATALAALALATAWFGYHFDLPGRVKTGLVLFDDAHVEHWGRSDRLMETTWYGDYSTYNFNSAVEWTGQHYPAAVNRDRTIDADLLENVSVLVLKTPSRPFDPDEIAAITSWVRGGGGLFAIGDHTDLHGMNTHLNAVLAPFGVRLEFDAVSDAADGSFNGWTPRRITPQPGFLADVREFEFMTSCSLSMTRWPRRAMVVPRGARDIGDYGRPSNFGARRSDPASPFGPAILAAAVESGAGRVVVFTDSTVFSSFEHFEKGHDAFFASSLAWLSRESPKTWRIFADGVAWTAAATFLLLAHRRRVVPALACAAPLVFAAAPLLDTLHHRWYATPAPDDSLIEAAFLWKGAVCGMPATLGSIGSLPTKHAFDTLLTNVTRTGIWPRVAREYEECWSPRTRVIFAINPVWTPPSEFLARLGPFVAAGGVLIVMDPGRGEDVESSAASLLTAAGVAPQGVAVQTAAERPTLSRATHDADIDWYEARVGRGHVHYARPSEQFSRAGLGHSFSLPDRAQRARLELVYRALETASGRRADDRRWYDILERTP